MKPLDCKGEINKCKIDIMDNRQNKILGKLLTLFTRKGKRSGNKRNQRGR